MTVVEEAKAYTQEPTLPRMRKIPKRINDGDPNHQHPSAKALFRQQYYEVFDVLLSELNRRFDQPTFSVLQTIERLIVDSCNGNAMELPSTSTVQSMYAADLKMDSFRVQLSMLPDVVRTANTEYQMGICKVTSISTVCEIFNTCKFPKTMLRKWIVCYGSI